MENEFYDVYTKQSFEHKSIAVCPYCKLDLITGKKYFECPECGREFYIESGRYCTYPGCNIIFAGFLIEVNNVK